MMFTAKQIPARRDVIWPRRRSGTWDGMTELLPKPMAPKAFSYPSQTDASSGG